MYVNNIDKPEKEDGKKEERFRGTQGGVHTSHSLHLKQHCYQK